MALRLNHTSEHLPNTVRNTLRINYSSHFSRVFFFSVLLLPRMSDLKWLTESGRCCKPVTRCGWATWSSTPPPVTVIRQYLLYDQNPYLHVFTLIYEFIFKVIVRKFLIQLVNSLSDKLNQQYIFWKSEVYSRKQKLASVNYFSPQKKVKTSQNP